MHSTILGKVQKYIGDKNKIRAITKMHTGYKTIEELKTVTMQVDCDGWKDFFSHDKKGQYSLYGLHQFLCEKTELYLLVNNIGNYQTAIKEILDDIGIDENDVNGPGGNHIKLIAVDNNGFIVYETKIMNF